VHDARDRQAALRVHGRHATEACRRNRAAVIGVVPADHDAALRLAHQVPVASRHAENSVICLGARVREEHPVELLRRDLAQHLRELDRRRIGALEETVVVRQLPHLLRRDVGEFVPAVADVHAPEARHRVEDLEALRVVQVHAVGARDDPRALGGERPEIGEGMQVVASVQFLPVARPSFRDTWLRAHNSPGGQTFSSRCSRSHELMTREKVSYSFSLTAQYAATKRSPNNSTSGLLPRRSASASASVMGSENGRS